MASPCGFLVSILLVVLPATVHCQTCTSKHDLVFIMDASGSLGADNFGATRVYVRSVIEQLQVGLEDTRVALVTFGDSGNVVFYLDDYATKTEVLDAVDSVVYTAGSTDTVGALEVVRDLVLVADKGDRPLVGNTIIMLTDGASKTGDPGPVAAQLQADDVVIYTIGIGTEELNPDELAAISSDGKPTGGGALDSYNIIISDFAQLLPLVTDVAGQICLAEPACDTPNDIVFLIDGSGSMGEGNFTKVLEFVKNVVNGFVIGSDATLVGALTFSNGAQVNFYLDEYSTKNAVLDAIENIPYPGASTDTIAGFDTARIEMFTSSNGDRDGVPNYAIIVTDGASKTGDPNDAATATKNADITVMAIGVQSAELNPEEIDNIASDPKSKYSITAQTFDQLNTLAARVKDEICVTGCESSYRITPYSDELPGVGRAEVKINGNWFAVCDDQWDDLDARVICSCLHPESDPENYKAIWRKPATPLSPIPIGMDELACTGNEADIFSCKYLGQTEHNCDATQEAAGIACVEIPPYVPQVPVPELSCNTSAMATCFNKSEIIASKLDLQPACPDLQREDRGDFLCYDIPHGQCSPQLSTDASGKKYCYRFEQKSRETAGSPVFDENWDVTSCCNVAKNGSVGFGYKFYIPIGNYSSSGDASFDMRCYLNPNFDGDPIEFPVSVLTGQDLYCKVCLDTEDPDMLLVVPNCWLSGPSGAAPEYSFIEDKCPVVSTLGLAFYPISRHCWGFKFTAMNYNDRMEMYVSCNTFACDSNLDGKPYCDRTCLDEGGRRKRDIVDDFKPRKSGRVDKGPFIVENGGPVRSQNGDYVVGQHLTPEEMKKYWSNHKRIVTGGTGGSEHLHAQLYGLLLTLVLLVTYML